MYSSILASASPRQLLLPDEMYIILWYSVSGMVCEWLKYNNDMQYSYIYGHERPHLRRRVRRPLLECSACLTYSKTVLVETLPAHPKNLDQSDKIQSIP